MYRPISNVLRRAITSQNSNRDDPLDKVLGLPNSVKRPLAYTHSTATQGKSLKTSEAFSLCNSSMAPFQGPWRLAVDGKGSARDAPFYSRTASKMLEGASRCKEVCQPCATFSLVTVNAGATIKGGVFFSKRPYVAAVAAARPSS